jgi:hypothetical protein
MSHLLSASQQNYRHLAAMEMLQLLREHQSSDFTAIAARDESWFQHHHEPHEMLAAAREPVTPDVRTQLAVEKGLITVSFPSQRWLSTTHYQSDRNSIKIPSSLRCSHGW